MEAQYMAEELGEHEAQEVNVEEKMAPKKKIKKKQFKNPMLIQIKEGVREINRLKKREEAMEKQRIAVENIGREVSKQREEVQGTFRTVTSDR